jgi:ribosomal protein S27E
MTDIVNLWKQIYERNPSVNTFTRNQCPDCGEMERIFVDQVRGDVICRNCGGVITEKMAFVSFKENENKITPSITTSINGGLMGIPLNPEQERMQKINQIFGNGDLLDSYLRQILSPFLSNFVENQPNYDVIANILYFLKYIPKTAYTIHKLDTKRTGFRLYEVVFSLYYYLYFQKTSSFAAYAEQLRLNHVQFSLRRLFYVKSVIEKIPIFRERIFCRTEERIHIIRKRVIQQYYTTIEKRVKIYVDGITPDMLRYTVQKRIEMTKVPITVIRREIYDQTIRVLYNLKYEKITSMTIPMLSASLIFNANFGTILREHAAKVCGVCSSGIKPIKQ